MSAPPIIALAFANKADKHLATLQRERKYIYESLGRQHDAGHIRVEQEGNTSIDDLIRWFVRYPDRIAIFHYGGHADGASLELEASAGDAERADARGLAQLLGQQKSLQLVFLNGCATRDQTALLFARGVKAVIATSVPINDGRATKFAQDFYEKLAYGGTLQDAFDHAASAHRTRASMLPITQSRGIPEPPRPGSTLAWGLYLNPAVDDQVLHWKLPAGAGGARNASDDELDCLPYLCDRTDQEAALIEAIEARFRARETSPMLCVLHGRAEEEHDWFLTRISRYSLADRAQHAPKKMHVVPVIEKLPARAGEFDHRLLAQLRQLQEFTGVASHTDVEERFARGRIPILALVWTVRTTEFAGQRQRALELLRRFCEKLGGSRQDRLLLCIVSFKYERPPPGFARPDANLRYWWTNRRMRAAIARFKSRAAHISKVRCVVVEELPMPNRGDVESWAKHQRIIPYLGTFSESWLNSVLGEAQCMPMDKLAQKLRAHLPG